MTWTRAHADAALHGVIDMRPGSGGAIVLDLLWLAEIRTTVNTSAPIDQLAHIRELAKDSPFNNGLVTLCMAADPPTAEMVELAHFVSWERVCICLGDAERNCRVAALDAPLLVGAAVLRDEERRALEEDEADMEKKAGAAICVIKTRLHRRYEHQA
ncbi:hypothetical protein B0H14DRAFT_2593442 [Mycena olivaceomarginata]|nr:hypothetical protein B0H14DRAFT_2593442 [Mycena olivaceomarginata]